MLAYLGCNKAIREEEGGKGSATSQVINLHSDPPSKRCYQMRGIMVDFSPSSSSLVPYVNTLQFPGDLRVSRDIGCS